MISFNKDLAERVIASFFGAFFSTLIALWAASGLDVDHLTDWSSVQHIVMSAVVAGGAAVFSYVKGLVAKNVGEAGTPSLAPVPPLDTNYDLTGLDVVDMSAGEHAA